MARNKVLHRLLAGVAAATLAAQAQAASCPATDADPAALRSRLQKMDRYFLIPGVATYRALKGLGDIELDSGAAYAEQREAEAANLPLLARILGVPAPADSYELSTGNCRLQAPLAMLRARIKTFGGDHPYVDQWLKVERAVFSTCPQASRDKRTTELPPPLGTADAAVARLQTQDRAYQQAAMAFYARDLDAAAAAYDSVAADRASPNRPYAAYMAAAIRAGSLPDDFETGEARVPLDQTLAEIDRILADPSLTEVHAMTASLIGWIGHNTREPAAVAAQVREAVQALQVPLDALKPGSPARDRYVAAASDIDWLIGSLALAGSDPLADWLAIAPASYVDHAWVGRFDGSPDERAQLAKARTRLAADADGPWKARAQQAPSWSVVEAETNRVAHCQDEKATAALPFDFYHSVRRGMMTRGDGQAAGRALALQRLQAFPFKTTNAFQSATHDSLQFLVDEGDLVTARRMRDRLGLDTGDETIWRVDDLLLVMAEDEDHLVRALAREDGPPTLLNSLSVAAMWRLAARSELSPGQRARFARTAWTRDYALGRVITGPHDQLMRSLNPGLVRDWRSPAGRPVRTTDSQALRDVLKSPGLNPILVDVSRRPDEAPAQAANFGRELTEFDQHDHNDNNWWCAWETARHQRADREGLWSLFFDGDYVGAELADQTNARAQRMLARLTPMLRSSFLYRNIDRAELRALAGAQQAPKLLTQRTIDWVRHAAPGDDPNAQAEALADAVAVTRWSCNRQGGHGVYSKAAYNLLHSRFPQSEAAKRAKYWFDKPMG